MKKFLMKYANVFAAFALIMSTALANQSCGYHIGQVPAPTALKKLRKF